MPPLKDLGAEFHNAASKLEEARASIEKARQARLAFVRDVLRREEEELESVKRRALELPTSIATYRAEIARLEASTADDLLRKAWPEWEDEAGGVVTFADGVYRWSHWHPSTLNKNIDDVPWGGIEIRPLGTTRAHVEELAKQAPSAPLPLLDLRTVRMESDHADPDVLIADADLYDHGERSSISQGERFTVERSAAPHGGPRVKVTMDGGSQCFIAAMQPAHVISPTKHACPRCDEGMRDIRGIGPFRDTGTRRASSIDGDGCAAAEGCFLAAIAYEFVRDDIPPPSEWCDGSGKGGAE